MREQWSEQREDVMDRKLHTEAKLGLDIKEERGLKEVYTWK